MKQAAVLLLILLCLGQSGALRIRQVGFEAGFAFDEARLRQASGLTKGSEYSPETVSSAIEAMRAELARQGRYFVRVPNPELIPVSEAELDLLFTLEEVIASDRVQARFIGMRYFSEAKLRQVLMLGEERRFTLAEIPRLMDQVLDQYHQRGYLFAKVGVDSLVSGDELTAWLRIDEGKPFKPERYYFEGNQHTRDRTLIKLSGLEQKTLVTPRTLDQAEQNILRKPYIRDCVIEPIEENSLLIKVDEGRMTYLEGILGLNQRQRRTELNGLVRLRFLNLWGTDRSIGLLWKESSGSGELELSYHESGLDRFPLSGDIYLHRAVQDSSWIRSQARAEIYSYFGDHRYGVLLGGETITPGLRRPPVLEKSSSRSAGVFWRYDSRRPRVNPTRGFESGLAYRLIHTARKTGLRDAFEADYTAYLGITDRFVAALGWHLRNLNDATATDHERYRMGGTASLRGYAEDEYSSHRLGWANYELRYHLDPRSRVFVFVDHGAYAFDGESYATDLLSLGLGIRINTRLGILGIAYGLGYRENGFTDLGSGMIHAGVDLAF